MRYWDNLVIQFLIFSFIGYICEVIFVSVGKRRLVNRGFLYGPWLPIYGFGGIIIKICLVPLAHIHIWGPILVFILAVILTSMVEYFGSWMLEKCFSIKLWDYSHKFCNINGRVCLLNSSLFGVMGLFCVYLVEPFLNKFIQRIPDVPLRIISDSIVVILVADTILSVVKMSAFKNALKEIRDRGEEIEKRVSELKLKGKDEIANELKRRLTEELEELKKRNDKRADSILSSFPTLTSSHEKIKKQIQELKAYKAEARRLMKEAKLTIKTAKDEYRERETEEESALKKDREKFREDKLKLNEEQQVKLTPDDKNGKD